MGDIIEGKILSIMECRIGDIIDNIIWSIRGGMIRSAVQCRMRELTQETFDNTLSVFGTGF